MSDKSVYQINLEFLAKRLEGDADEVVSFFEELFDLYFGANAFHKLMVQHNIEALRKRIWDRHKEWRQQPLHIYQQLTQQFQLEMYVRIEQIVVQHHQEN